MIKLSYSSLKLLNGDKNHEWLNKQMGIEIPDYPWLKDGRENQRPIQLHIAGKEAHPYLDNVNVRFSTVEEKDFDERCHFEFDFTPMLDPLKTGTKDQYLIHGYYDAVDMKSRKFGEIKLSSKPMGMSEYQNSFQRKIYALSNPVFKESVLITGLRKVEQWKDTPLKVFELPLTAKDRSDAIEWIIKGIGILEAGEFKGGLDENNKCLGCFWGQNCAFL